MSNLKEHCEAQQTDILLDIAKGDLTEIARKTLNQVLAQRNINPSEIESAKNIGIQLRKEEQNIGSLGKRFLAILIDIFLGSAIAFIVALPFSAILEDAHNVVYTFLFLSYLLLRDCIPGQGLGKRLLNLRVVQVKTEKPCTLKQSIIRNLFHVVFLIDLLFALGKKRMRLGDIVAGTMVINRLDQSNA